MDAPEISSPPEDQATRPHEGAFRRSPLAELDGPPRYFARNTDVCWAGVVWHCRTAAGSPVVLGRAGVQRGLGTMSTMSTMSAFSMPRAALRTHASESAFTPPPCPPRRALRGDPNPIKMCGSSLKRASTACIAASNEIMNIPAVNHVSLPQPLSDVNLFPTLTIIPTHAHHRIPL